MAAAFNHLVLVTGATGFVGRAVCRLLASRGVPVLALVRREPPPDAGLNLPGITLVRGTLDSVESLTQAVRGAPVIVHCAGGGRAESVAALYANNRDTTANLLAAARATREATPLKRVVFVSSIAALGPSPRADGTPEPPHTLPHPVTHYGRSKAEAEALVTAESIWLETAILRPPTIYGPGDDRLLPLFKGAVRGLVPFPAPVRMLSLAHIDDVAAAIAGLATADSVTPTPYTVCSGPPVTPESFASALGEAVGRSKPARAVRIPLGVLNAVARSNEAVAQLRGQRALFNRDKVVEITQAHWVCDNTAPRMADLSGAPKSSVPLIAGLAATAADFRSRGWLKG